MSSCSHISRDQHTTHILPHPPRLTAPSSQPTHTTKQHKKGTFITLFNLKGEVLLDETPVPGAYKFEGLEFALP